MFELRAHHGLCIRFFQGNGYSKAFTANMHKVIAFLEAEDPPVTLVTCCDRLCAACPHHSDGICTCGDKPERYDHRVLKLCGFAPGKQLHWSELTYAVYEHILIPERRREVCGDCQWNGLCEAAKPQIPILKTETDKMTR